MARLMAQKLGEVMGASFVVENRTGLPAPLVPSMWRSSLPMATHCCWWHRPSPRWRPPTAGYDPVRSFSPVGMIASGLVWAANNQITGQFHAGTGGIGPCKARQTQLRLCRRGRVNHLVLELLKIKTNTFITHIPYRGVAPAAMDMVAGQIHLVTGAIPALLPLIKDGRIKALAVTSAKRSPALPNVPSMSEAGFSGFDVQNYFALAAPAATPPAVIENSMPRSTR